MGRPSREGRWRAILRPRSAQLAQALRSRAESGTLLPFVRKHLPHYVTCEFSPFHEELARILEDMSVNRDQRRVCVAPRGAAKSTIGTVAHLLWAVLTGRERYVLLLSDTASQAEQHLEAIRHELEHNASLRNHFPGSAGVGPTWTTTGIITQSGARIDALGARKALRGRRHHDARPTLVVIDDPVNDESAYSTIQRERLLRWFDRALMKVGGPGTNFLCSGTVVHSEDLVSTLMARGEWRATVWRAIVEWPVHMDLWAEWEAIYVHPSDGAAERARSFYEDHREAMEEGAEVLWPQREPLYELMCMRAHGHAAFASEKQNEPVSHEHVEWPTEYTQEADGLPLYAPMPDRPWVKVMAVDPSKGRNARRGDYSAIVVASLKDGIVHVDADLARRPTPVLVEDILNTYEAERPDALVIEGNAYQDLLADMLASAAMARNLMPPAVHLVENTVNKDVRIRRLGPLLQRRHLRFRPHRPGVRLLLQQLAAFPLGDHDDGPDALEMAINRMRALGSSDPVE